MNVQQFIAHEYNHTHSLLESPHATGFESYERWAHQKSESISLTHAQDYLLVGEFKEGGGGEYLTVSAQDAPS